VGGRVGPRLKGFGGRAGGAVSDLPDRKGSAEP